MSFSDVLRRLAGPDPALAEARGRAHTAELEAAEARQRADDLARKLYRVHAETAAKVGQTRRERDAALAETAAVRVEWGADRSDLCAEITRLREAHHRAATRVEELRNVEPPQGDGCRKIRLRDEGEAAQMIASLARDTGRQVDEFETYPCRHCPRHPLTFERYLHVTNRDPRERTGKAGVSRMTGWYETTGRAKRDGRLLEQRLDPGVAERLRGIAGTAS